MATNGEQWDRETDVLVVGTGGAGLTAALVAAENGARVSIIEKTNLIGGTTAVSGGSIWIPNNHHAVATNIADSHAEALRYVTHLAAGRSDPQLMEAFLNTGPEMVKFVEACTLLRFQVLTHFPDYYPDFEGGKAKGRSLDPGIIDATSLGRWKDKLRRSPIYGMAVMSITELKEWGATYKPLNLPFELLQERFEHTVQRFNESVCAGKDRDFHRGESLHDHIYGDPNNEPNPNLGPIEQAPFYALRVYPGSLGTKGGVKLNTSGQVLHVNGRPIGGLYAAGNMMAGVTGPGYPGAGIPIGTGMTFGFIAGRHAARSE